MKDLKFEQERSLSRVEAADQLMMLATALRKGGEADLELGAGTLSLRIPEELRCEVELEVEDGEIELEIELTWSTGRPGKSPAAGRSAAKTSKASKASKPSKAATAKAGTAKRGKAKTATAKPSAAKTAKPKAVEAKADKAVKAKADEPSLVKAKADKPEKPANPVAAGSAKGAPAKGTAKRAVKAS
ncbi:amphi-Trp domain-containing protein [Streptomyces zaomyceticus]|uniref:amphi-Trp domain-containing protein n=1 Tax=Streptomyces zaomyceticus TaxID=68286 RepID=UPI00342F6DA2